MSDQTERIKNDLRTIETALGLNLWTRWDVRRGFLGVLAGGAAGLFLALWSAFGGNSQGGMLVFLAILAAIVVLKGAGYARNPAPAAGSPREIAFYNRFYTVGGVLIGCFFVWGEHIGMELQILLSCAIVMTGLWYTIYAISAPSREISVGGAIPLTLCGFALPFAHGASEMFCWLGCAACVGCWVEAALLFMALHPAPPPAGPESTGMVAPALPPNTPLAPSGDASH